MPEIMLDDETYERLLVASRLMDESLGEVVRRLVERLTADLAPKRGSSNADASAPALARRRGGRAPAQVTADWVPIFKIFKGHRVEGSFNPTTHEVRIADEPWRGKYFTSPTAAAQAVVEHYAGDVRQTNNTNGRKFWKVIATGRNLRSLIGER